MRSKYKIIKTSLRMCRTLLCTPTEVLGVCWWHALRVVYDIYVRPTHDHTAEFSITYSSRYSSSRGCQVDKKKSQALFVAFVAMRIGCMCSARFIWSSSACYPRRDDPSTTPPPSAQNHTQQPCLVDPHCGQWERAWASLPLCCVGYRVRTL